MPVNPVSVRVANLECISGFISKKIIFTANLRCFNGFNIKAYELTAPKPETSVAFKIIDMLGKEVLVVETV